MRLALVAGLASLALLAPAIAKATDLQACIAASERGQRARAAGKLREARDQFQICGVEGCPTLIRRDCVQWQSDLASVIPSVVFGAKDKRGHDLLDVTVSMDGDPLVKKLDGKAVSVDPGPHTFRFDATGAPPVTERVLVKEGERARAINVVIADATELGERPSSPAVYSADRESRSSGGHTAYPWILGGLGVTTLAIGIVWLAATPAFPESCNQTTQTCQRLAGESEAAYKDRQGRAGRADGQPSEAAVIMGIGGALLVGGIVWYLLEPSGSRSGAIRPTPWTTANAAGVSLGGTF